MLAFILYSFIHSESQSFFYSKHLLCASVLRSEETETKVSTVKEVVKQRGRQSSKQVMGQYCDAGAESTSLNSTRGDPEGIRKR